MTERKGKIAGQRLGMVLVEIDDDETLVEQPAAKEKLGPLALLAVQLCKKELFRQWLADRYGSNKTEMIEADTSQDLKKFLGIASRKELDTNIDAARRFEQFVRKPFVEWQEQYR
jgi:hypothetical protein